jgi:glucan phosphoethanolaminetransferase (alkaline phosphatase superfamily)
MKKIGKITFTIALIIGTVVTTRSETVKSENNKSEVKAKAPRCAYLNPQITEYLQEYGYSNISLSPIPESCDMMASTENEYDTRVFVAGYDIVGHEDMPD